LTILRANTRRIDLAADVDLAKLAAATPGMLGSDLRRMVTDAQARAHRRGQGIVQREDFRVALGQMAIDTKRPLILSEARRWRMAYHEAGHALVGMLQPGADVVRTASILPSAQVVEAAPDSPESGRRLCGESYRRGRIIGLLGGYAAEHVVYGRSSPEGEAELKQATTLARQMVGRWAAPDQPGSASILPILGEDISVPGPAAAGFTDQTTSVSDEAERVARECYLRAVAILGENRARLDRLAETLLEHETLDEPDVRAEAGISNERPAPARHANSTLGGEKGKPAQPRAGDRSRLSPTRAARVGSALWTAATRAELPHVRDAARQRGGRRRVGRALRVEMGADGAAAVELPWGPAHAGRAPGHWSWPKPAAAPADTHDGFRHRSVSALSAAGRVRYWGLALLWAFVTTTFWVWWLRHAAHSTPVLYWLQTTMLFYQTTLLPTVYWGFVGKMRKPIEVAPSPGIRVALVTLCVPGYESLDVILTQLDALKAVSYPHDSWILDEGDSAEVRALARERGVSYFTRRGVVFWNQPGQPFQAKTKAGNVNVWLDHVASLGLDYDVFVQFDIDHRPRPDYLERTLGYFRDARVGWVQAPSVYGNVENWAARGLMEQDLVFHGPLQMGFYGSTQTPFIIGSHTSYRMAAVREIGGFQPTRAEDHLDTVVLAAHGYTGVFVPELIAVGDGPHNLAIYLRQQFAWAYSMIQIFFHHTPGLVRRYTFRQAFQFLFCQTWYTFWSLSLALLWVLPSLALLVHRPIASVKLSDFLLYFTPVILASSLMWCESRRWFQPANVKLSWRGIILGIARWPAILWALINVVLRIKRPYMITPKGVDLGGPRWVSLYGPGLVLTLLPLGAIWAFYATSGGGGVRGYFGLALANAVMGLVLVASTVALEIRQIAADVGARRAVRLRGGVVAAALAMLGLLTITVLVVWAPLAHVIT
jgi:cellulose synthase (UDP-forming)